MLLQSHRWKKCPFLKSIDKISKGSRLKLFKVLIDIAGFTHTHTHSPVSQLPSIYALIKHSLSIYCVPSRVSGITIKWCIRNDSGLQATESTLASLNGKRNETVLLGSSGLSRRARVPNPEATRAKSDAQL